MLVHKLMGGTSSPKLIEFVGFSAVNGSSISVPSGSQAGDLLVLFDRPIARSVTLPTGFTSIGSVSTVQTNGYTLGIGYRLQASGDSSFTSASSRKTLACFRANFNFSVVAQGVFFNSGGSSPITVSVSVGSFPTVSFTAITHSTGTTADTPSANSTLITNFHLAGDDLVLGAWFGINESISLTSTDSNANLLTGATFRLDLE